MSRAQRELAALRAARDAARANLGVKLGVARSFTKPFNIVLRLRDMLTARLNRTLGQVFEIAGDHRGVVAGTVSAVLLWLVRRQVHTRVAGWLETKGTAGRIAAALLGRIL